MTYADGGPTASSTKYAAVSGTMVQDNNSWGLMDEGIPDSDVSQYTGISFDMRGQMKGFQALAIGDNSPIQDHNANCPFTGTGVPTCAVDQGVTIAGVTDGFAGSAPDIGAFESGVTPFVPGAQRAADSSICGKVADITSTIPPQAPTPWTPAPDVDAGVTDAGVTDAGAADAGANQTAASSPDAGGPTLVAGGGGCGCRIVGTTGNTRRTAAVIALLALAGITRRRRRR